MWATYGFILLGDEVGARRVLDGAKGVAEVSALWHWSIRNQALDGFLVAREGHVDRGIELMQGAAEEWASRGFKLAVPHNRAFLAQICLAAGRLEEALARPRGRSRDMARETGHGLLGRRAAATQGRAPRGIRWRRLAEVRRVLRGSYRCRQPCKVRRPSCVRAERSLQQLCGTPANAVAAGLHSIRRQGGLL